MSLEKMTADESPLALPYTIQIPPELAPRTTSYTLLPPSPPHIHVPAIPNSHELVLPAYEGVGGEELTEEDLKNITQVRHVATDQTSKWKYEWRRLAQLILPFIYLGPSSATKDRNFLRNEGITMLLVIRDTKSAKARLLNGSKVAQELGIASAAIDVAGCQELIAAFPNAIKIINEHLLSVYRQQALNGTDYTSGNIMINQDTFRRGKVLVFCESGNERSACVVTAYIMAIYGMDLVSAVQFVQSQRFCVALDDQLKGLLWSFQDILQARRDVGKACRQNQVQATAAHSLIVSGQGRQNGKRHIEETIDDEMEIDELRQMDEGRFEGRNGFVPFLDSAGS